MTPSFLAHIPSIVQLYKLYSSEYILSVYTFVSFEQPFSISHTYYQNWFIGKIKKDSKGNKLDQRLMISRKVHHTNNQLTWLRNLMALYI